MSSFVSQAVAAGYEPQSIDGYLSQFTPAEDDIVHVESGAWVNQDCDFGSPITFGWNWPPQPATPVYPNAQFDIPTGWSVDQRGMAVLTAALNWVLTARANDANFDMADVQQPSASSSAAEIAAHYLLPAGNSGYEYYGTVSDMPLKVPLACNAAVTWADWALGNASQPIDNVPPSVFTLQRLPYNPGACECGCLWNFNCLAMNNSFFVYTYVADYSGVARVTLHVRVDEDGVDSIADHANDVYEPHAHGLAGVGPWANVTMQVFDMPAGGNPYNVSGLLSMDARETADRYFALVSGYTNTLLDYYVSAVDERGNVANSPIFHVWIGDQASANCAQGE